LPGEAKASSNLAHTLKKMGEYNEAIVCSQRHLDIAKELSDKARVSHCNNHAHISISKRLSTLLCFYRSVKPRHCTALAIFTTSKANNSVTLQLLLRVVILML